MPTIEEVKNVIEEINDAPGADSVQAELLKYGEQALIYSLQTCSV